MTYTPTRDVIVGIVCVLIGCAVATGAFQAARRTRNWLFFVCAVGGLVFTAGVVGQRVFPSADALRFNPQGAGHQTPRAWEAGVQLPVINVSATPVAVGGALLAVVGLSLVLFFEAVPERPPAPLPALPDLEAEDAV